MAEDTLWISICEIERGKTFPRSRHTLLGIIRPVSFEERTNHPVAFLLGYGPDDRPKDIWLPDFSDPKDGLLPPALTAMAIVDLLKKLVRIDFFDEDKLIDAIRGT